MENRHALVTVLTLATTPCWSVAQTAGDLKIEMRSISTGSGDSIDAQFGSLLVPEVRSQPSSRLIEIAFVRLKSPSAPEGAPAILYFEGGTRMTTSPQAMTALAPALGTGDIILIDQRGRGESRPGLNFRSSESAGGDLFLSRQHFVQNVRHFGTSAHTYWEAEGVDLRGYTTEEIADDVADLCRALEIEHVSLIGFSQNTQTSFSIIRRHPALVSRAVLLGVEGPNSSRKLPSVYDRQIAKISALMREDSSFGPDVPDFETLLRKALDRLAREPIDVGPFPGAPQAGTLVIGPFGFQVIIFADIGDTNDINVLPRLAHSVSEGDPSLLRWFARKRFAQMSMMPIWFWTMDAAADATPDRWAQINREAQTAILGSAMNLAHPEIDAVLGVPDAPASYREPPSGSMPVLMVSGTLDSNTPPEQAERLRQGFPRAVHVIIENAGHEDYLSNRVVQELMFRFLMGETLEDQRLRVEPPRLIPLEGSAEGFSHPALRAMR